MYSTSIHTLHTDFGLTWPFPLIKPKAVAPKSVAGGHFLCTQLIGKSGTHLMKCHDIPTSLGIASSATSADCDAGVWNKATLFEVWLHPFFLSVYRQRHDDPLGQQVNTRLGSQFFQISFGIFGLPHPPH